MAACDKVSISICTSVLSFPYGLWSEILLVYDSWRNALVSWRPVSCKKPERERQLYNKTLRIEVDSFAILLLIVTLHLGDFISFVTNSDDKFI